MNSETQITRPWRARSACAGHLPHHFRLGEANSDWGGAESIDSDVDMEMAEIPRAPSCSLEPTEFQVVPVAHEPPLPREKRSLPLIGKQRLRQHPLHQLSYLLSKLKDLFAPHEDEGELLAMHRLVSLITSLLPSPQASLLSATSTSTWTCTWTNPPAPVATSSRSGLSAAAPPTQHKALDSSLPFFFPQKAHVQKVSFTRTEDEA